MSLHVRNKILNIGVLACTLLSTLAVAHPNDYEDFYNTTQGKGMSSDSGCRIVMCMLNPKGPLADKKCRPDIKTMFKEIIRPKHQFVPMCQGFSGVSMEAATNADGKPNGAFFYSETVRVWRPDGDGGWQLIYESGRTPGYMPINGTTNTETPATMWNGTQGNGRISGGAYLPGLQSDGSEQQPSTSQRASLAGDLLNLTDKQGELTGDNEPQVEDLMAIRKLKINVFTNTNTRNITAEQYDLSVVASLDPKNGTQTAYVKAQQPGGTYFRQDDMVVVTRINPNRGDLASYKKASSKYGTMVAAPGSNNSLYGVILPGHTEVTKIPQAVIDTTKSATSYTYTDDKGQVQTITPTPVNQQGQVSYVDSKGQTQVLNGQTVDNISINGQAFFETRPGSSVSGRSNEYIVNLPGIDDESPNRSINALDAVMPAE